jgi:epoxyqueuosine reductase
MRTHREPVSVVRFRERLSGLALDRPAFAAHAAGMAISSSRILAESERIGFDAAGIAEALPSARAPSVTRWIAGGMHGEMNWLARDLSRRLDPRQVLAGAQSVIVCGLSYHVEDPPLALWNDPLRGRVARYAWGRDYHDAMLPMLEELAGFVRAGCGAGAETQCYVDTGPVLERDLAERAGLGFIGKNTLLIHEGLGSLLFLGVILVTAPLESTVAAERPGVAARGGTCGNCRRCQDICPTHAFPVPYVLDARLCISYLTIELKGAIPVHLRPLMKNWIFGCDECQTVCPWVRRFSRAGRTRFLKPDPELVAPQLAELLALNETQFRERFRGTPLFRTKRRGILRNACVALGNSGRPEAVPLLQEAQLDAEPLVREHAEWALKQLRRRG